jgi:hypothetical protein
VLSLHNREDLRAVLLHMATAAADAPDGRRRVARWLRAALALVEDEDGEMLPPVKLTPEQVKALEELAMSLSLLAGQAEFLAEKAALTVQPPP